MPIIKIYGIGPETEEETLIELIRLRYRIRRRVAEIKELSLRTEQVTVFFIPDLLTTGRTVRPGDEVIAFVEGLFKTPQRTKEVQEKLAETVVELIREFFPEVYVECLVNSFDPELDPDQAFACSDP